MKKMIGEWLDRWAESQEKKHPLYNTLQYRHWLQETHSELTKAIEGNDEETAKYYGEAAERIYNVGHWVVWNETLDEAYQVKERFRQIISYLDLALQHLQEKFSLEDLQKTRSVMPFEETLRGAMPEFTHTRALVKTEEAPPLSSTQRIHEAMTESCGKEYGRNPGVAAEALVGYYAEDMPQILEELDPAKPFDQTYAGRIYKALQLDKKIFEAFFKDLEADKHNKHDRRGQAEYSLQNEAFQIYMRAMEMSREYQEKFRTDEFMADQAFVWRDMEVIGAGRGFGGKYGHPYDEEGRKKMGTPLGGAPHEALPPSPRPTSDYYGILGLEPGADTRAIKSAYRRMALRYHPDRNPGDATAVENFKRAAEAYEALTASSK